MKGLGFDAESAELEKLMTPEERALYERFKANIGKEFVPHSPHPMFYPWGTEDPVQWSSIKRWATINGDFNALWFDPDYASKSRWGGVTAPPLYLLALDDPVAVAADFVGEIYDPNCLVRRDKYPTFRGSMMANAEFEFFRPIRPGDRIDVKRRCTDIYWRQGQRYRLLFLLGESIYTNQKKELVAIS
ncbi:MAG: MaoC family dehydratase N-terminal domain-containing protein, partial [Dehalococcoidia bacterium]|nr:MaoC family dehydratase N-terminal domain-containing protein [Dehalococcoidia bacterium]